MERILYKRGALDAAFIVIMISIAIHCYSEEPSAVASPSPVLWAQPVNEGKGLGKFLGKTMETVSHKGASILPKFSKKRESADQGAPADAPLRLFDPHRNESPIRTARLFKIQINPPDTESAIVSAN